MIHFLISNIKYNAIDSNIKVLAIDVINLHPIWSDLVIRVTRLAGVSCGDGRTAAIRKAPLLCRSGRLIMLVMHLVYIY